MTEAGRGSGCPALRWAGIRAGFRLPPPPGPLCGRWGDHQTLFKKKPNFNDDDDDDDGCDG